MVIDETNNSTEIKGVVLIISFIDLTEMKMNLRLRKQLCNPIGFNGKPMKCKICESILHFMRDCPHRQNSSVEENVTLFTGTDETELCLLGSEARNSAILDSGCTSTVAGAYWVRCFLDNLHHEDAKKSQT